MAKSVAILQSSYIPWKGYFDLIRKVDTFIFYDDVQYTNRDWRNRNKIKTPHGLQWLSIPCGSNRDKLINEVRVDNAPWQQGHYQVLENNYRKAPYWKDFEPFLGEMYIEREWAYLSDFNQAFIESVCRRYLHIDTALEKAEQYHAKEKKEARILELLEQCGATHYLSGPAARSYLNQENFAARGITLEYMDYGGYPEYPQLYPPFEHAVSILDLLLNTGPDAVRYLQPLTAR